MANMATHIKDVGEKLASEQLAQFKALRAFYWSMHQEMSQKTFSSPTEQIEAVKKLSQLGLAMAEAEKAYSAINKVRCITD